MKGEALFAAMGSIDERFVLAAAEILEAAAPRRGRPFRLGLAAAVLIALLLAACAAGIYFEMFFSDKTEHPKEKLEELWLDYEDLGLVLRFEGPQQCRMAGFRANYLPSEPNWKGMNPDGLWFNHLADDWNDDPENGAAGPIPYSITRSYVSSDYQMVFGGDTKVVKDESRGELRLVELESQLSDTPAENLEDCRYLLIFDEKNGYLITMYTTLHDMAELEKMAAGLEIHVYTETVTPKSGREYVVVMPGRG